jgi:chromosome segregation ATPase
MASHCPFCDRLDGATSARNTLNIALAADLKTLTAENEKLHHQVDWMAMTNTNALAQIADYKRATSSLSATIDDLRRTLQTYAPLEQTLHERQTLIDQLQHDKDELLSKYNQSNQLIIDQQILLSNLREQKKRLDVVLLTQLNASPDNHSS